MFREIIKYDGEWIKDSFITLSEKPGIGAEINEEGMKKHTIADFLSSTNSSINKFI